MERFGWTCSRCSASNSPDVQRCACSPVQQEPRPFPHQVYPWYDPWPAYIPPSQEWRPPYITWTSTGTSPFAGAKLVDAPTKYTTGREP